MWNQGATIPFIAALHLNERGDLFLYRLSERQIISHNGRMWTGDLQMQLFVVQVAQKKGGRYDWGCRRACRRPS